MAGDYETDPDAELGRPTDVSLTDTRDGTMKFIDLPTSCFFRSLARSPGGQAIDFGSDRALHVIDPKSGEVTSSIGVIGEWEKRRILRAR